MNCRCSLMRRGVGPVLYLIWLLSSGMVVPAMAADADPAAAAHRAAEGVVHQEGNTDPLSVDPDLAIWTVVVFVVLLLVLKKFAWKPLIDALESRESGIHEQIKFAKQSHEEAKAMLGEYERKVAGAAEVVKAMLEEARRDAENTKIQVLAEAKAGAEVERNRALRDVEAATDAALKQIGEHSANLAVDLAGKILGAKLSADDHNRLIADAVKQFPTTTPSRN
jgi:F-type H+-transporting ATPase subunit b